MAGAWRPGEQGTYSIWQVEPRWALGIYPGHRVVMGMQNQRRASLELPFGKIPLAALWIEGRDEVGLKCRGFQKGSSPGPSPLP